MPNWARFVTGVEQAIETLRNEADARLRQEQEPAKVPGHGSNFLEQDGHRPVTNPAPSPEPAATGELSRLNPTPDRLEAIDVAIGTIRQPEQPALRLIIPAGPVRLFPSRRFT